ncbi:hypothetical protein CBR_g34889 [Chara braunii]|uniref:Integrase catalytic domain-containing protein n=1 Tax=Chara braunii TaxID=69332 RepID=A0A388LJX2_CHABU|nr:hypothetical protein CBR_g34889 [Chara braunii]|eukprot:GBG82512.1 hypothetical protein CBR_g34889 [Chara braunii]
MWTRRTARIARTTRSRRDGGGEEIDGGKRGGTGGGGQVGGGGDMDGEEGEDTRKGRRRGGMEDEEVRGGGGDKEDEEGQEEEDEQETKRRREEGTWRMRKGRRSQDQQCHVSSARSQCHVRLSATSAVMSDTVPHQQCHVSNMTGLPGQPNESLAAYKQRFQAQIEAEEQCQLAAEAARVQAEEAAAAEQLRLQADADADAQARHKEAQDLLQRHEANSIDRVKFWHFELNGDEATPEEKHKEFLSKLVTRLLYACNYQRSELERQYQDLTQQHQELAKLRRMVQSHEDATRALNARLLDLEQAQLQTTNADGNPKMFKMPTFNLERFDDYTQQDPVLWWEAFTTQLRILPVAKHAYIGTLFLNSKGGCQTWLSHLATSHGVDVPDLKDKITWEELTRLWNKRFIVDDAPALAINRLFTMSQGNTATRDWLTEWQKIAAVPNLDLPFTHLRREFYNRSCAALSQALGDRKQYSTFAEIIDKAREIIKTNSRSLDEHVEHLRTVLERLRLAKYKANHDKCEFAQQELEYLGHYVTPQGIRPLEDKIEALRVWPEPTNTTDVRSFMGLAGYYQRFITGYSRIAAPMTRLQSPKVPFVFDDDARRSFQALKTAMLMAPVLSIYNPTLPTQVTTDASGYGIGAVLEQQDGDEWHPVEYFNHKVPPINSLDDARKKELLAFMMALKRWRHFLLGRRRFTWVTDNNPFTYYKTQDTVSSTIGRWMYFIDQFDFTPKHVPGLSNRAADALSRRPDLCDMTHHAFAFDEELQRHFIRAYQSDPDFGTLYAQLSSDHPPASHYRIADGYLLLHSRGKDLLCVPRDRRLRTRLLGEYHDSRLADHFGVNRTIARLRQRFRWPDLITDATRYCDSCEVCRRSKPHNRNPYGELHPMPIPREPGLSIALDVTGPFPRDRLEHDGILTVVDRLSKYACFLPCKYYSTTPELARLLHTGWICGHGVPEDIVSDCDTCFMSAFWTALMQESGTTMKPSSARHPQTDGQTERAHQTAQMMLRTLIRPDQKDWVDPLPDIEFAHNTSVHPAIGVTPFELHHGGRKGRIFADLLLPRPADIDAACSPASVWKYRELLAQARANMQKAQVCMQQQANRRRVPCPIRAGDLVWVSAEEFALEQDVSRKLLPKWFGPWSVTAAAGDEPDGPSFVINIPEHLTVHLVFHASKLATYTPTKSDDFPGRRSQDPPSMDGHQEVDRVISDRKYGSKPRQYKVTFKACDRDDTRWISCADLKASAPLIYAHYEKRRLTQEASRPAPPTRTVVPPSDRQLRPRR